MPMKSTMHSFLICLISLNLMFTSCQNEDTPSPDQNANNSRNKIMPLGASRVAGARPEYESCRYDLWKLLIDGEYEFDFLGTETDNASYPAYKGLSFDNDHEGRGGITSGGILSELSTWLNELGTSPDIVLFSSPGGNDGIDVYQQTVSNVNAIIDVLQNNNPNVTIFIELPAPPLVSEQTTEFLAYYNQALRDIPIWAEQQTTSTSKVIVVDMKTGFNDSHLADDVHYNASGANFIANKYYSELVGVLQ